MASYKDLTDKYLSIFSDFNLTEQAQPALDIPAFGCDVDDDCDGFCPECKEMIKCEAYNELKEEWDSFYM
jgi:hypothetical protein